MKTNIFSIASSELGPEDKFTACLHYLIENVTSVGQGIVDVICQKSGSPAATFRSATDHPAGDEKNRPDFLLSCNEFDILCEYKLDSDLGERQLERYLQLPSERATRLILISNRNHAVSDDVFRSDKYLRPTEASRTHFYWEDFFPVITRHSERLAQDFIHHMRDHGMAPCPLVEDWENLFSDAKVAESFIDCTTGISAYFKMHGAQIFVDPSKLGFQIRKPHKSIQLIYISAERSTRPFVTEIAPPYLRALIYVPVTDIELYQHMNAAILKTEDGLVNGRPLNKPASWDNQLILCYEFHANLTNCLAPSGVETTEKLAYFGKAVFDHLSIPLQ